MWSHFLFFWFLWLYFSRFFLFMHLFLFLYLFLFLLLCLFLFLLLLIKILFICVWVLWCFLSLYRMVLNRRHSRLYRLGSINEFWLLLRGLLIQNLLRRFLIYFLLLWLLLHHWGLLWSFNLNWLGFRLFLLLSLLLLHYRARLHLCLWEFLSFCLLGWTSPHASWESSCGWCIKPSHWAFTCLIPTTSRDSGLFHASSLGGGVTCHVLW